MRGWIGCMVAAVAALAIEGSAQDSRASNSLERPFARNGIVKMDLVAGDYLITGTSKDRVRVEWSTRDPDAIWRVKVRAEPRDRELKLETDGPSTKGLKFVIEVPSQSDLYVRLSAGDLKLEDVRGNKDVEVRAGDLRIDVGRAADYRRVDASLWAGDIKASAFRTFKGGLFRSFDWNGDGTYRLHARLMAGDLYLYEKSADSR